MEQHLRIDEAASAIGVTRKVVERMIDRAELPAIDIGLGESKRAWRIPLSAVRTSYTRAEVASLLSTTESHVGDMIVAGVLTAASNAVTAATAVTAESLAALLRGDRVRELRAMPPRRSAAEPSVPVGETAQHAEQSAAAQRDHGAVVTVTLDDLRRLMGLSR